MRRYLVRFAVAVLTFAIGVSISIALGLFKPSFQSRDYAYHERRGCGRRAVQVQAIQVPEPVAVEVPVRRGVLFANNLPNQPLNVQILSSEAIPTDSLKRQARLLVENRSSQRVDSFVVSWETRSSGVLQQRGSVNSNTVLQPGASDILTVDYEGGESLSIQVTSVVFANGSHWTWERDARIE